MNTLLDLFAEMERLAGREAILHDDGFRTRRWSYRELLRHVAGVSDELAGSGLGPGDRILLWGENRPEWVAVFWGALARRIAVVPVDFRSSAAFVRRVQKEVDARLLFHGGTVDAREIDVRRMNLDDVARLQSSSPLERAADPSEVVQILYTSGTTGDPKGIVHRHRHLVPNLIPIQKEIQKYATLARPFQPIRFLDLLPLSHVFGQFTGLYVPVLLGGSVAFQKEVHPAAILSTIRRQRITVLVSVPRFLEGLRREVERRFQVSARPPVEGKGLSGGLRRYWRHWDVHRAFGLKFGAILSGGARLSPEEEDFWYRMGFPLVQGYGLTETSSLVATNHPFHPTRGSLGKVVGDQEIRLAPDGEILVRGSNVSMEVFGRQGQQEEWLHTGDVGEIGPDGTLYYKGRKKDVIVGPEGLNVYPADVEAVLKKNRAVKDSVVLGLDGDRGEVVHAVLLLSDPNADGSYIVEAANRELEPHQRIRRWTIWPDEDFPRTASTFKIRRHQVVQALSGRRPEPERETSATTGARALVARQLGRSPAELRPDQSLSEDLGLSSIDRVELLASLEEHYGRELSEAAMARVDTIEDLERWVEGASDGARVEAPRSEAPREERRRPSPLSGIVRFARAAPVRAFRTAFRETVTLPLFRRYIPLTVEGSLEGVTPPVIFAPNHTSNLDTIALLAALPRKWRNRIAPAISEEYFLPYLRGTGSLRERISLGSQFWLASVTMNIFPLPQATEGVRDALQFAGKLVDAGYSILIYPEGIRTPDGKMHPFRPGVGLLAVRLSIPVVPVHIQGLFEVMSLHESWPKPGPARLRFGMPISFDRDADFREVTETIEREVRRLGS